MKNPGKQEDKNDAIFHISKISSICEKIISRYVDHTDFSEILNI